MKHEHVAPEEQAGFLAQPSEDPIWTYSLSKDMVNKKMKKLGWFQKMMLCINVEKGERRTIANIAKLARCIGKTRKSSKTNATLQMMFVAVPGWKRFLLLP
jgi:hypothetical protein